MMIKFTCPQCGQVFNAEDNYVGTKLQCCYCNTWFYIPKKGAAPELIQPGSKNAVNAHSKKTSGTNFEPHRQSSPSASKKSSHHRSSFENLRNQATIVSGSDRPTIVGGNQTWNSFPGQTEKITFSLPFAAGDYLATDVLAQGGMSVTYIGHRISGDTEKVVIKIPDIKSQKTIEMFSNECKILAELKHPHIVPILASGEIIVDGESFPYMVMKFIDGQSLRQKIKAQGHLSWKEASKVLGDISEALKYLYENNFCHRDIKPDNIIFDTKTDNWILVDFGIAKSLQDNIMLTMTMAGQDSGTWDYMPPEQLDGKSVDIRCDIYALGTVIWESLIGTVPRRGTKLPAAFGLDLPADVDILIEKMVEHNPEDRYQTPSDLLNALHSGAGKVEKWKKRKGELRIFSRYCSIALVLIAVIVIIWVIGNFASIAKLKEIYEQNKSSATITLSELNKASAKMPFYWGKSYYNSVTRDLQKKADKECRDMQSEFAGIRDRILQHKGSDEELESRKALCENFIKKWRDIFVGSNEITTAQANLNKLSHILLRRKENLLLSSTIETIKKNTAEKKREQYRDAFEECRRVEKILTLPDIKKKLEDFIAALKKEAVGNALEEVASLLSSDSREDWVKAYQEIDTIRETIGNDPQLTAKQNEIDDKLWDFYLMEAAKAVKENRFTNAKQLLESYKVAGMKRHSMELSEILSKINQKEELFHWNDACKKANQYMKDHAFIPALDAINLFASRYPNPQIVNIPEQRKIIGNNYANYISQQLTDLDTFQENLKVFLVKFPDDRDNIKKLRRNLCVAVRYAIAIHVSDSTLAAEAKSARLTQIKYTDCEEYQKDYLKKLLAAAENYAVQNSRSAYYGFLYYYQRPPADCVKMKDSPTIFDVTITSINVDLSDSHYQQLKGMNNCDPEIRIMLDGYTSRWKLKGPVNTRDFTFSNRGDLSYTPRYRTVNTNQFSFQRNNDFSGLLRSRSVKQFPEPINFWWNIKDGNLKIQIADADDTPFDAPTYEGSFDSTLFKQSSSSYQRLDNGTTIKIEWTTK